MHSQLNFLALWLPVIYSDSFSWNHSSLDIIVSKGVLEFSSFCRTLFFPCQESIYPLASGFSNLREAGNRPNSLWQENQVISAFVDVFFQFSFDWCVQCLRAHMRLSSFVYNDPGRWTYDSPSFIGEGTEGQEGRKDRRTKGREK